MEVLAMGAAMLAGLAWPRLTILGFILFAPVLAAAGLLVIVIRYRARADDAAPGFCDAVAAELRSGSGLVDALRAAGASAGRPAIAHLPPDASPRDAGRLLQREYPEIGDYLDTTITAVAGTGPQVADLFDEIGTFAMALSEIRSEVRVSTASARATAFVLFAAPAGFFLYRFSNGGLGDLFGSGSQVIVASAGLALFVVGLTVSAVLVWRSA